MLAARSSVSRLAAFVFFQMLPATLVVPAVRPLFAVQHAGDERAMHAFMALNMVGAVLGAPLFASLAQQSGRFAAWVAALCLADGALLWLCSTELPTGVVLTARLLEGATHVGAASLLMGEAAARARREGTGKAMGIAGTALLLAVAAGSSLGGALLGWDTRAPLWVASALALAVGAAMALGRLPGTTLERRACLGSLDALRLLRAQPALWLPVGAAFVARFSVGCLVVTFAVFAHASHDLSDRSIGFLFSTLTLPFALLTYPAARSGDSIPRAAILGAGAAAYATLLASLGFVPTWALAPAMLGAGVASAAIFSAILCYAATAGESRTAAMSLVNAAGCLGMILGPAAAGIVSATLRSTGGSQLAHRAVFALAAAAVAAWLISARKRLWSQLRAELARERPEQHGETNGTEHGSVAH